MAQEHINTGTPNGNDGDFLRDAFVKVENNTTELYNDVANNISNILTNSSDITSHNDRITDNELNIQDLTDAQTGGLKSFLTLALLEAYATPNVNDSYKVTNDPTPANNGYYHWVSGTNYQKDELPYGLSQTLDPLNTTEAPSNKAVADYTATLRGGEVVSGETRDVSGDKINTALEVFKRKNITEYPVTLNENLYIDKTGLIASRNGLNYSELIEISLLSDYITYDLGSNYSGQAQVAFFNTNIIDPLYFVGYISLSLNVQHTRQELDIPVGATHFSIGGNVNYAIKLEYFNENLYINDSILRSYKTYNTDWNVRGYASTNDITPSINVSLNDVFIPTENGLIFGKDITNCKKQVLVCNGTDFDVVELKQPLKDGDIVNHCQNKTANLGTTDFILNNNNDYNIAVEENETFKYKGFNTVINSSITTTNYVQLTGSSIGMNKALQDDSFDGYITHTFEAMCSNTCTVRFFNYTSNFVGNDNIYIDFIANVPRIVTIRGKVEDTLLGMGTIRYRIYGLDDGFSLKIGREGIFTGINEEIDFANFWSDKIKNEITNTFENNEALEIGGYYDWFNKEGLNLFSFNEGRQCVFTLDPNHPFSYKGNCADLVGKEDSVYGDFNWRVQYSELKRISDYKVTPYGVPMSFIVEVYSEVDDVLTLSVTATDSVQSTFNYSSKKVNLKAGEVRRLQYTFYIPDYDNELFIGIDRVNQNIKLGRVAFYLKPNINTLENNYEVAKKATREHTAEYHTAGLAQEYWGDSMTARISDFVIAENPDINVEVYGYGGYTSVQIANIFLDTVPDPNKFYIFWVGRNNLDETQIILSDVKRMIAHCGTMNYLVLGITNGDYPGEYNDGSGYHYFSDCNDRLRQAFGERFLDVRKYVIESCDYGNIFLESTFTQPSVGSNVTITVNDTSNTYYNVGKQIVVGSLDAYLGTYTIISIDDATTLTLRLDIEGTLAVGQTFTYEHDTILHNYSQPQQILSVTDIYAYSKDIPSDYQRADTIHLGSYGNVPLAKRIRQIIKSL